jgi:hypothetical protein
MGGKKSDETDYIHEVSQGCPQSVLSGIELENVDTPSRFFVVSARFESERSAATFVCSYIPLENQSRKGQKSKNKLNQKTEGTKEGTSLRTT